MKTKTEWAILRRDGAVVVIGVGDSARQEARDLVRDDSELCKQVLSRVVTYGEWAAVNVTRVSKGNENTDANEDRQDEPAHR